MRKKRAQYLYELVTPDRLELPLIVGTADEVARYAGVSVRNIYCNISRYGDRSRYKKLNIKEKHL